MTTVATIRRLRPGARRAITVAAWAALDALCVAGGLYAAIWMRYDFDLAPVLMRRSTIAVALLVAAGHLIVAGLFGAYSRVSVRASFDEVRGLAAATIIVVGGLSAAAALMPQLSLPRTVGVILGLTAYTLMLSARFVARAIREARVIRHRGGIPLIIFGAGNAGRLLAGNLVNDPESHYRPVAFLDDDRAKRRMRIHGVPVRGNRTNLAKVAARTEAEHVVIAIPSATGEIVASLRAVAEEAGLTPLVVPPLSRLVGTTLTGRDIKNIDLDDLLGRRPIRLDAKAIGAAINHKVVLVTGAGGSIGSELCRQLSRFNPAELVMLDRDESALHSLSIDLIGNGLLERRNIVLADIRDPDALHEAFAEHRPDIVFHAAALKHLPLLETYPAEGWKSNVLGTLNVLRAARAAGVETFVNISTDKAAEPSSVLGYSKRIAERLTAGFALGDQGRYLSVRFGNVLGSRGSVIPAFQAQIKRGGPVTVTDPEAERYFMLIPEACQLVMQAAAIGQDGEVLVLDMGQQVKILQVAKTLISMSGNPSIEIQFTGLRPGEKLSEDLFNPTDDQRPTSHPLVSAVDVPPLLEDLDMLTLTTDVRTLLTAYATGDDTPLSIAPLEETLPRSQTTQAR